MGYGKKIDWDAGKDKNRVVPPPNIYHFSDFI